MVSFKRDTPVIREVGSTRPGENGILLPNNQRQHRTLHIQKNVLPYALCWLLCPVSAALASFSRMDSIATSYLVQDLDSTPPRASSYPFGPSGFELGPWPLQGYLVHKKMPPP